MSCLHSLLCRLLPHQHCGMFRPPLGTCGGKPSRELWPRPSTTMMSGRGLNFSCCPKACSVPLAVAAANTSGQPRLSRWTGFSGGMKGSAGRCGSLALSPPRSAAAPPTLTDRSWPLGLPGKVLTAKPVRLCFRKACAQPQQRLEMHCKLCTLRVPPRPLRPSTTFLWPLRLKPVVATALRSFPSATAPGCSGLRVQHIREAMPAGVGDGLLDQLVAVVNLLVQGRACPAVAPFLAGANLVALPKPSGGVRPIAIGEVLRRLTGKCLMQLVHDDARTHFWPAQAGVAVKAGVESAVHTLRAWLGRHATAVDRVVVKLDFSNAFNTVSREVVLKQARDHFPALARWATWCYSSESRLQFGDFVLGSSTGVQQGDPLGPLLFAAALQPLAEQLRSSPLDLSLFYLDDGVLAGSIASVSAALTQVQGASADLGLALNLRKSEVMLVGRTPPSALQGHLSQALLTSSDGSCRLLHDFDFLGAAIGSAPYMERHAAQRVSSAAHLLEAIGALPDAQVALRLLRACGGHARLLHTMRCCPPAAQPAALAKFDQLVQQCFSSFTGIHCSAAQWAQAARGLPLAGLGLRSTADHSPAAYLASVGACHQQCCELDPAYPADLTTHPDVLSAVQLLNAHLETAHHITPATGLAKRQQDLSRLLDQAGWASQLNTASAVGRASLISESDSGGRAFLAAIPHGGKRMDSSLFVAELRLRLQVEDAADDTWCPKCDAVLDKHSHHAAVCLAGGERTHRHHAVRDLIASWAERAGLRPEKEKPGLLLPHQHPPA